MDRFKISDEEMRFQILEKAGLEYEANFLPIKQPKGEVKNPQLNWSIYFKTDKGSITTNYSEGIGHVKHYRQRKNNSIDESGVQEAFRKTCETGKLFVDKNGHVKHFIMLGNQPKPGRENVIYCLLSDADCLDYTFQEWCDNMGYNTDSIKDKELYEKCIHQSVQFRRLWDCKEWENLKESFQDF